MTVAVKAQDVKALRDITGTGMMDSKRALEATDGDLERAKDWLRQKGIARAGAKAARGAREGTVEIYVHHNKQLGVLVELNSESDFVARTEGFQHLAHEIALHIAAANPRYVRRDDVPAELIEQKRADFHRQATLLNKPSQIVETIVDGKLNEFFKREVLLEQPWTKDDKRTVNEVLNEAISGYGENITVSRFARFKIGQSPEDESDAGNR
jgi:elongation factor Ts